MLVGCDKTVELVNNSYWFPKMKEIVKFYTFKCLKCQNLLHPILEKKKDSRILLPKVTSHLALGIHNDHLGPFEKASHGHTFTFLVTDKFTKFVKIIPN